MKRFRVGALLLTALLLSVGIAAAEKAADPLLQRARSGDRPSKYALCIFV